MVRASASTLLSREMLPFRRAVRAGIPALMTAHVVYPALDPEFPATLSRTILRGILRGRLRFSGSIFSDALEMKAILGRFGIGEAAVRAVSAGCDAVLVCRGEEAQEEVAARLAREARENVTFRRAMSTAERRTARLRAWAASKERRRPNPRSVGSKRHRALAALLWEQWGNTGRTSPGGRSGNIGEG